MARSAAVWNRTLKFAAGICAILTAAFAAMHIDWSFLSTSRQWWVAPFAFCITALVGAVPYGIYALFVPLTKVDPIVKALLLLVLIALSAVPNVWWIETGAHTNGWNFLIIPVVQVVYLLVVAPVVIVFIGLLQRTWVRWYGT
ncbi:hypothetical protein [Xanthomonas bonasiae]|uniref:hypothetical protein n=1 Tax=Xanthomonas bonasiae TaxID=2810351 RepID=UPI0019800D05|nr:hypothetical protein [Xanthomonas bonasiae]MBN6112642.1 hypothetical protein [Xanthomonas bonasiae]